MQERQVTGDGTTHRLGSPFMVIATQNPIEFEGTFPLPEAQLDRFAMVLRMGYPSREDEARLLADQAGGDPAERVAPVCDAPTIRAAIGAARSLHVDPAIHEYVVALLHRTRDDPRLALGASPRAGVALLRMARARALLSGRGHVVPEDVAALAPTVLAHRVILTGEARADGVAPAEALADAVDRTPTPL
jgi:MoxR-like ATPase